MELYCVLFLACENIRFSSLFSARNVPSGEERGETDVFAGYPFPRAGFLQIPRLRHTERIGIIFGYTPDISNLQAKSKKVRVIGSSEKIAANKRKKFFSSTVQ